MLEDARPLDPLGTPRATWTWRATDDSCTCPARAPRSGPYAHLAWIDRHGRAERLPFADNLGHLALSPDQRHVAVSRFAAGDIQVWIYDLERGTRDQLTRDGSNFDPRWSPAGDRVAFTSLLTGQLRPPNEPAGRCATARGRCSRPTHDESKWEWLPDGRSGVFESWGPTAGGMSRPCRSAIRTHAGPLAGTPLEESDPQVSPDGRWLAWSAADTVYVARYPEMTGRVQVAVGASTAKWAHRSHEFFFEKDRRMHVVSWTVGPSGFATGTATALFAIPRGPSRFRVLGLGRRLPYPSPRERPGQGIAGGARA